MSEKSSKPSSQRPSARKTSLGATITVIVLLVGYVILRPTLERWLGIELPGVLQEEKVADDQAPTKSASPTQKATVEGEDTSSSESPPGQLSDVGSGVLESPAGLRYAPGSLEGHRLDHVLRHASDQPNRPGKHSVFDGDQNEILAVIDEAYLLAQKGGSRVDRQRDGPRTIYTVDMQRRVGYLGGQVGGQRNHPPSRGVRIILEGRNVISAYPVKP